MIRQLQLEVAKETWILAPIRTLPRDILALVFEVHMHTRHNKEDEPHMLGSFEFADFGMM